MSLQEMIARIPNVNELTFGSMCVCAMHCKNHCEIACCGGNTGYCLCWCHAREYQQKRGLWAEIANRRAK